MIRYPVLLLMLATLYSSLAHSEPAIRKYMNGIDLANLCLSSNVQKQKSLCPTYLVGVSDGFEVMGGALGKMDEKGAKLPFCKPKTFTVSQFQRVVTKYLKDHPEELHYGAAFLVFKALSEAFSC